MSEEKELFTFFSITWIYHHLFGVNYLENEIRYFDIFFYLTVSTMYVLTSYPT